EGQIDRGARSADPRAHAADRSGGPRGAGRPEWGMIVRSAVRRSAYYDSVALMQAQQALRSLPGIVEAGAVMGTEANLDLLRQAGLDPGGLVATGDDLVVALRGDTESHVEAALASLDALLRARPETGADEAYRPRTIAAAARMLGGAILALVSVPGRFAAGV